MGLTCIPYMPVGSHIINIASQAAFQLSLMILTNSLPSPVLAPVMTAIFFIYDTSCINNAGYAKFCSYGDLSVADSLNMINLNIGGVVAMGLTCIPYCQMKSSYSERKKYREK